MYHCCVPSVCLKDGAAESAYIKDLYTAAPYANYYDLYKSTGKKAKLGSYTLHAAEKGGPGVINFFIRTYPGEKIMPSDTLAMRRDYLKRILRDLDPAVKVKVQYDAVEMRDYADILTGTEAAELSKPAEPAGIKPAEPAGIKPAVPAGIKPAVPAGIKPALPAGIKPAEPAGIKPALPAGIKPAEPAGIPDLFFAPHQLVNVLLYETDYVALA